MVKSKITPKQFLESKGMKLTTTTLITVIDGCNRQPDLCALLQEYANTKVTEYIVANEKPSKGVVELKNMKNPQNPKDFFSPY